MAEHDVNSLIQFSGLSKTITWVLNEIKFHSQTLNTFSKYQKQTETNLALNEKKLQEVETNLDRFQLGLVLLQKFEDKLTSWSERFRLLEETLYNLNSKMTTVESNLEDKLAAIRSSSLSLEKRVSESLKKQIDETILKNLEIFNKKIEKVQGDIQNIKNELESDEKSSSVEETKEDLIETESENKEENLETKFGSSENKELAESNNEYTETYKEANELRIETTGNHIEVQSKSKEEHTENQNLTEVTQEQLKITVQAKEGVINNSLNIVSKIKVEPTLQVTPFQRTLTLHLDQFKKHPRQANLGINSRISRLESHFISIIEELKQREQEKPEKKPLINKNLYEVRAEIEEILSKNMEELRAYRVFFENLELDDSAEKKPAKKDKIKKRNSWPDEEKLNEKLNEMEERYQNLLKELKEDIEKFVQPADNSFSQLESSKIIENWEPIKETLETQNNYIIKLDEKVENLQKITSSQLNRSELGDILMQFARKIKENPKEKIETEDWGPKLFDVEQRLNKIWRSNNNSLEVLSSLEAKVTNIEKALLQIQETKSINIEFKISTLESSLSEQIKDIKENFKLFESIPELAPLENERYFRSMILSLKTDLNNLKDDFSNLKSSVSPASSIALTSIESIHEPIQLLTVQDILKQHESAIRVLANKVLPNNLLDSGFPKVAGDVVELTHLEELKREMKEMIQKKEENQRLSKQDMELVQKISDTLEGKIGKEELGNKAEKEDLKRIYSLLKKRIDILADALKRNQGLQREEPFFMKKKLNLECASCGRLSVMGEKKDGLPDKAFNKSPTSGIAFSKILSSLIPNSRGGLRLPIKADKYLEPLASPKSKVVSKK